MSKKATIVAPNCGSCAQHTRLTDGREVYPQRPDLHSKPIWKCDGCGGYVGCHPGTTRSLGTPADKTLRDARMTLHREMIDQLWKTADQTCGYAPEDDRARMAIQKAARSRVYAFLAAKMELKKEDSHTGMFSLAQCREAWVALRGVTYPDIRAWHRARQAQRFAKKSQDQPQQQQQSRLVA